MPVAPIAAMQPVNQPMTAENPQPGQPMQYPMLSQSGTMPPMQMNQP